MYSLKGLYIKKILKSFTRVIPSEVRTRIKFILIKFFRQCSSIFYYFTGLPAKTAIFTIPGGGIILSFDDYHITDWFEADKIFKKYNWKATFSISNFDSISKPDIEKLKILQSNGHEIAFHGNHHINAVEFISTHTNDEYLENEIIHSMKVMTNHGFLVKTFAYPFGARNKKTDKILFGNFKIIRGTTYGKKSASIQTNFANGSKLVFGLGIDEVYGNDINYILSLLDYAKEHNKIAIFYGHHIKNNASAYSIDINMLEEICRFVTKNNMHFLALQDLYYSG